LLLPSTGVLEVHTTPVLLAVITHQVGGQTEQPFQEELLEQDEDAELYEVVEQWEP
jgi:hypothetical protein